MDKDDIALEAMLQLSDKGREHDPSNYWFSWPNQQKIVFQIATRSYLEFDMDPEEAVRGARDFVNTFYKLEIKH